MFAVATFLIVALVSLLFTRLATGMLIATGMPPSVAAFQARSAFTGAGFTTTEAENVVNHPVRRRVISITMFVGNLGIPTLIVTLVVGLVAPGTGQITTRLVVLIGGVALLVLLAFARPVTRLFVELGQRSAVPLLEESFHGTVESLLALGDDVDIVSITLGEDLPIRSVRGLQNALPQLTVLGVRPQADPRRFVTGPPSDIDLHAGDAVVVLGRRDALADLLPQMAGRSAADAGD